MKILAVMPSWLGDCLMAIPSLGGLAVRHDGAAIDVVIKPPFVSLASLFPFIRKTFQTADPSLRKKLRQEGYDAVLLFPNSFSSAWRVRGIGARRVVGYGGEFRSLLLTDPLPRPPKHATPMTDYYQAVVRALDHSATATPPPLLVPADADASADTLLDGISGPIIGIGFGATYGAAKMWPAERFGALIDRLGEGGTVITLGSAGDKETEKKVVAHCERPPRSLVGETDLPTLAAVMRRLAVYVTNDTGPMHLAAMVGTPVVALFGPTDPTETPPAGTATILHKGAACDRAPCFLRECPIDHRCMEAISVNEAFDAAIRSFR